MDRDIIRICLVVLTYPSEKLGVKVSWDDDIPNMMGKINAMFQTTNQFTVEFGV